MPVPKKVLVFGAGRVSGPIYQDLAQEPGLQVTAVSRTQSRLTRAEILCPGARLEKLDILLDTEGRDRLIQEHDVVIGIVPLGMMYDIARSCIEYKKDFATACYASLVDKNLTLHKMACDAGVTLLFDLGLKPGIDHMLGMRTIDDIKSRGGEVTTYEMWSGGLPAPEHSNNPLKYKFSWNPRGNLWAYWKGGGFLKNGEVKNLPMGPKLMESAKEIPLTKEFQVEAFPLPYNPSYPSLYGIDTADTFIRGTLRHKGCAYGVLSLIRLGLFDDKINPLVDPGLNNMTWRKIVCDILGLNEDISDEQLESKAKATVKDQGHLEVLKELGLLSHTEVEGKGTLIDTLAHYLGGLPELTFGPKERDLVVMHIDVEGKFPDGSREKRDVNMIVYGETGKHSAMAKTVGHTIASAAILLLTGKITQSGVVLPTTPKMYNHILADLETKGLVFSSKSQVLNDPAL